MEPERRALLGHKSAFLLQPASLVPCCRPPTLPGPHPCLSCTTFWDAVSVTSLLHYLSQDIHKDKQYPRTPHSPPLGSLTPRSFLSSQQGCHGGEDHALPQQVWSSLRTTAVTKSHTSSPAVLPSGPTAFPSATSRILPIQATPSSCWGLRVHKGKQEAPGQTRSTDVQGKVEGEKAREVLQRHRLHRTHLGSSAQAPVLFREDCAQQILFHSEG
nr:uncharacterized protein LOC110140861 [Odocoileus virginianus texanus]